MIELPEIEIDWKKKTCGECKFLSLLNRDEIVKKFGLQAPNVGDCRHSPPVPVVTGYSPEAGPQIVLIYPRLAELFAACSKFAFKAK